MNGRIVAAALLAGAVAAACAELSGPLRPAGYAFTLVARDSVTADTTIGSRLYHQDSVYTDTVWFYWPRSRLPVRIWVDTLGGLDLPMHIEHGIALWKSILQYGEYDATLVSDSAHADVQVFSGPPPLTAAGVQMRALAPQCSGATDVRVSAPDHKKLLLPVRIYIENKYPLSDTSTTGCLALTAAHELGHSLGLFQHSDSATDLMAPDPVVPAPTARDASTVLFLYHFRPDLVPSP